ncbi:hypothetical protein [Saccharothrix sp.]|uniref:hypothetical protein n=1 Tax=Saccharothrix sp. TaxID=1873460 RepID=UPI002810D05B|nr:hypothetical protein [Saccharothrix sp.]
MPPHLAPKTKAGLVAALVPLGFLVGFIVYATNKPHPSTALLVVIALCGAAVPLTVMIFQAGGRRREADTSD